jgi:DNA-binding transcriptional LysR family regulator
VFIRERNIVRLTPAGQAYAEEVRKLAESHRSLVEKSKRIDQGKYGHLSIGLIDGQTFAESCSRTLRDFHRRRPDVHIEIFLFTLSELKAALYAGSIDMASSVHWEVSGCHGLSHIEIGRAKHYIVISNAHRLAKKKDLRVSDFHNEVYWTVSPEESPVLYAQAQENLKKLGLTPEIRFCTSVTTRWLWVESGVGFTVINENHMLCHSSQVRLLPLPGFPDAEEVIAWKTDNDNPVVPVFARKVRAFFAQGR